MFKNNNLPNSYDIYLINYYVGTINVLYKFQEVNNLEFKVNHTLKA